jgi:drug/metabolite transporter (DMT)-like permease
MKSQSWVMLSLLSGFLMAVVNLIDRYILTRLVKQAMVPLFILGLIGLGPGILILLVKGGLGLDWLRALAGVGAGLAFMAMSYFYFRAAQVEEISRVVPLFYLAPLFVAAGAVVLLGENVSVRSGLGIAALVAGAALISSRWPPRVRATRAIRLMVPAAAAMAGYTVAVKYLLGFTDYWTVLAVSRIGMAVGLIPLFLARRSEIKTALRGRQGLKVAGFMAGNEVIALAGSLFFIMAAARGPIAVVNAVASTQPFFVFALSLAVTLIRPRLLEEDLDWRNLAFKMAAILLMFVGLLLLVSEGKFDRPSEHALDF